MTSLTPAQEEIRAEALEGFTGVLTNARRERAEIYARGGAIAVAEWAHVPGGPPVEELAARYEQAVQAERDRRGAPKAADAA